MFTLYCVIYLSVLISQPYHSVRSYRSHHTLIKSLWVQSGRYLLLDTATCWKCLSLQNMIVVIVYWNTDLKIWFKSKPLPMVFWFFASNQSLHPWDMTVNGQLLGTGRNLFFGCWWTHPWSADCWWSPVNQLAIVKLYFLISCNW